MIKVTKKVESVKRALLVLEALSEGETRKTNTEISKEIGIPASTTFRILSTLVEVGYAEKEEKYYKTGGKLLQLQSMPIKFSTIKNAVSPFLKKLNEETTLTVSLAIKDGSRGIIYEIIQGNNPLVVNNEVGNSVSLYSTALGKAILSFMESEERKRIIKSLELTPYTKNTITKKSRLKQEIKKIRKRGYANDNKEYVLGIECIAVPLIGSNRDMLKGSISVSGPEYQIEDNYESVVQNIKETGQKIRNEVQLP